MRKSSKFITQAAVIAAAYAALCHGQNLLLPGSGSWAVQLRLAEALCVLAFFTRAAIPGLGLGCLLFNITAGAGLPLDVLVGTVASVLAAWGMWLTRRWPWPGFLMPAICNGLLVGWELSVHMGGGFWANAGYVAAGEAIVLLTLGLALYRAIKGRLERIFQ